MPDAACAPQVFLTGASSGIGEAMAREWARRRPGVRLGLVARRADALARVAAECMRLGAASVACYALDVNDRAALTRAADDFAGTALAGRQLIVVASAGLSSGTLTGERTDGAMFERIMRTNVVAMFDTFTPFVPAMRGAGCGTLVGIASTAGVRGLPGAGAYSASKAAVINYLESARIELAASGVRVVTITPGFVRTAMTAHNPYAMPFLMDAGPFARRAVDAIERGARYAAIPWQMGVAAAVLRRLPRALYDAALGRAPRKPRVGP